MQKKGKLVLVTGGARSGKSSFAEAYASGSGKKVIYLATAAGEDQEMRERIREHQKRRPENFLTREEQYFPEQVMMEYDHENVFFLLDCLTLLLSNHLLKGYCPPAAGAGPAAAAEQTLGYVRGLVEKMYSHPAEVLVVTNEVGCGLVPETALGRIFRDLSGRANQAFAARADEVWLLVCGIPRRIK